MRWPVHETGGLLVIWLLAHRGRVTHICLSKLSHHSLHHNGHDSFSKHQRLYCLLNRFYGDKKKHQSSASLAFVRGIHRGPVNSPHKWPVTRKMLPFDDVIICSDYGLSSVYLQAIILINDGWLTLIRPLGTNYIAIGGHSVVVRRRRNTLMEQSGLQGSFHQTVIYNTIWNIFINVHTLYHILGVLFAYVHSYMYVCIWTAKYDRNRMVTRTMRLWSYLPLLISCLFDHIR